MKTIISTLLLLLSLSAIAQTGNLLLSIDGLVETYDSLTYRIYSDDSTIIGPIAITESQYERAKTLPLGKHFIEVTHRYGDQHTLVIKPFHIALNETTTLHISLPQTSVYYTEVFSDTLDSAAYYAPPRGDLEITHKYNGPIFNKNEPFSAHNQFGVRGGNHYPLARYLAAGWKIGTTFSHTYFKEHVTQNPLVTSYRAKYFLWSADAQAYTTFYFKNQEKHPYNSPFLQLGATYRLPLMFHHIISIKNTDYITHSIHNYTDLSAFASVGKGVLSVSAEYRLFDFLDPGFEELPRFRLGLTLNLSVN